MAVSLALVPVMVRLAPHLGMIDQPEARKVHARPIARVGGWGIVLGALTPIVWLLHAEPVYQAFILGALVLFAFGVWDDARQIGHWPKFLGQLLAVGVLVFHGGVEVTRLPFLEGAIPHWFGVGFTVVALIGVINALNHSDGLDGLAAGESLLSLSAMALLSWLAGGGAVLVVALATIGGLLGFLRYNTHPARVFMGDGGSQFLGYTVGFVAIQLVHVVDPRISPAAVALLLGLPVVDILVVLKRRIQEHRNWFRATRNHVHHRLLDLGFVHQESVVLIYSFQTLVVAAGVLLRYQPDWLILLVWVIAMASVFVPLNLAERVGWRAPRRPTGEGAIQAEMGRVHKFFLVIAPRRFLEIVVPLYLVVGAALAATVPKDVGLLGAVVAALLIVEPVFNRNLHSVLRRIAIYVVLAAVVFVPQSVPEGFQGMRSGLQLLFFGVVGVAVAVAVKFSPRRRRVEFESTAMDFLMVFLMFVGLVYGYISGGDRDAALFLVKLIVLWYAAELLFIERRERWNPLTFSALAAAVLFALRSLY